MVKKIKKYLKFVVCCALILSLIAPSYAALSASDGSAFVTKAEFDAALADFNSRLTSFESGINSKIDAQVTSYLDRNGIWNGKDQLLIAGWNKNEKKTLWKVGKGDGLGELKPSDTGLKWGYIMVPEVSKSGLAYINFKMDYDAYSGTPSYRIFTSDYSTGVNVSNFIATAFQNAFLEIGTYPNTVTTPNTHPTMLGYSALYLDAQEGFSQTSNPGSSMNTAADWGNKKFGLIPAGHLIPVGATASFMVSKGEKIGVITYIVNQTGSTFANAKSWWTNGAGTGQYWTITVTECKVY